MNKPLNVCSVRKIGDKDFWSIVGVAFPNKNAPGFCIILNSVPPGADGLIKLVVLPSKERKPQPAKKQRA